MRSDDSDPFDIVGLLDALDGVDFIVVGGAAVTLHGGPRLTFDLDIVPASAEPNVRKLGTALQDLGAVVREPGNRRLPLTMELLISSRTAEPPGQLRLRTTRGPLDVLWRLHDGRNYETLVGDSVILSDDEREVRVIGIGDLIEVKVGAGRPQDLEDVRYLERIRTRTHRP
jgi:hypothetical protein